MANRFYIVNDKQGEVDVAATEFLNEVRDGLPSRGEVISRAMTLYADYLIYGRATIQKGNVLDEFAMKMLIEVLHDDRNHKETPPAE